MSQDSTTKAPRIGERVELDRYSVHGCERVIYGQRIGGVVRLTDRPADGAGRSYLIERGLEQDGFAALKAVIEDYKLQSRRLDAVPMAASVVRRTHELEAA